MVPGATNLEHVEDYGLNHVMHRLKENKKQNSVNIFILITCSCTKRPELKTFTLKTNWITDTDRQLKAQFGCHIPLRLIKAERHMYFEDRAGERGRRLQIGSGPTRVH